MRFSIFAGDFRFSPCASIMTSIQSLIETCMSWCHSTVGEYDVRGKIVRFAAITCSAAMIAFSCGTADAQPLPAKRSKHYAVPEYERTMKRVLVSLAKSFGSLEYQDAVLLATPEYTNIVMLVPENVSDAVSMELNNTRYASRTMVVEFDTKPVSNGSLLFFDRGEDLYPVKISQTVDLQIGTLWAQDVLIPVRNPDGTVTLLVPPADGCLWFDDRVVGANLFSDNGYLVELSMLGLMSEEIPIAAKGGNIMTGEAGGVRYAFVGSEIVGNTAALRKLIPDHAAPFTVIPNLLGNELGVDKIVVFGRGKQPGHLYHLDQAVMFLGDSIAGVTRITGPMPTDEHEIAIIKSVEDFLASIRENFNVLGFTIIDINTPAQRALNYQYYANALPFTNFMTGRRTILLPVFNDSSKSPEREFVVNRSRLEALGYDVVPVPTKAGKLMGGIHCLMNVLE